MNLRLAAAASALALALVACGPQESATGADGTWVGTITTEGNVTTVINESGSVWGGTATLVEEASIGVDAGPDEYMLGDVIGVTASNEEIFVLDGQVLTVRVYDWEGLHLRDIGREGQGPGEFTNPQSLARGPDGRLFVEDSNRVTVFSAAGEVLDTWPDERNFSGTPIVVTVPGDVYVHDLLERGGDIADWRHGMRAIGPDGIYGEPVRVPNLEYEPYQLITRFPGGSTSSGIPFAPRPFWALAPSGAMIAGVPSEYSFEVHFPDGSVTVVEKTWDPVPVSRDEAEWRTASLTARRRSSMPDWTWDGPPIPAHKPAYSALIPDHSGRLWVEHVIRTEPVTPCDTNPLSPAGDRPLSCWRQVNGVDVFDVETGRYLGPLDTGVNLPYRSSLFIKGDTLIMQVEDVAGTIMVKRYRLVLPGEGER